MSGLPIDADGIDISQYVLHSRPMSKLTFSAILLDFPALATTVHSALYPRLTRTMTWSEIERWPVSAPYSALIAARLVADDLAEYFVPSRGARIALGFLDITPEHTKRRLRIITDSLWVNAFSAPRQHCRYTPLPKLRRQICLVRPVLAVVIDWEKAYFQFEVPESERSLFAAKVFDRGLVRFVRMKRMSMGYVHANDICHGTMAQFTTFVIDSFTPQGSHVVDPYVDGVLYASSVAEDVYMFYTLFQRVCARYQIVIGSVAISSRVDHRGISLDCANQTWSLKTAFVSKARTAVDNCSRPTRDKLEKALGSLIYADYALDLQSGQRPTHSLVRAIHRPDPSLAPSVAAELDVARCVFNVHRRNVLQSYPVAFSCSDSSDVGWSAALYVGGVLVATSAKWSRELLDLHINLKELLPMCVIAQWLRSMQFTGVWRPITDSMVAFGAIRRRYSPSRAIHSICGCIRLLANVPMRPLWIPSFLMPMDAPSRSGLLSVLTSSAIEFVRLVPPASTLRVPDLGTFSAVEVGGVSSEGGCWSGDFPLPLNMCSPRETED
jgi:hypothetical protein